MDGGGHGAAFLFVAGTGGYLQWLATACCLLSLACRWERSGDGCQITPSLFSPLPRSPAAVTTSLSAGRNRGAP